LLARQDGLAKGDVAGRIGGVRGSDKPSWRGQPTLYAVAWIRVRLVQQTSRGLQGHRENERPRAEGLCLALRDSSHLLRAGGKGPSAGLVGEGLPGTRPRLAGSENRASLRSLALCRALPGLGATYDPAAGGTVASGGTITRWGRKV